MIPLNSLYCKHPIYHKTSYNNGGGESKFPKEDEKILPPAELLADYFKKRKALDHEILRDTSDSIYHSFLMKKYDFVLFNERNEEKLLLLILPHIQNLRN